MTPLGGGNSALRARLLLPEQVRLFDLWDRLREGATAPNRRTVTPALLGNLLPSICVFDVRSGPGEAPVLFTRIAGSGLRQMFGFEAQNTALEPGSEPARILRLADGLAVAADGEPRAGSDIVLNPAGVEVLHVWLRLPLLDQEGRIGAVLGLDMPMALGRLPLVAVRPRAAIG